MNNFLKMAEGLNTLPLLLQVASQPELWDRDPERLSPRGPHHQTHDIWLRYKEKASNVASGDWSNFCDEHIPIWYPAIDVLPAARPLVFNLMAAVQGEMLGAVLIYKVPPGAEILPHTDMGWHPNYFEKFNISLQSQKGCSFYYPDTGESMESKTGDLYWFRNTVQHGVKNESAEDQIILTICIKTHNLRSGG